MNMYPQLQACLILFFGASAIALKKFVKSLSEQVRVCVIILNRVISHSSVFTLMTRVRVLRSFINQSSIRDIRS
jgi:hypothetical protein